MFTKTLSKTEYVYTSKLMRRSEGKSIQNLIDSLQFADTYKYKLSGRYPKACNETEVKILEKMFGTGKKLEDYKDEKGKPFYYRSAGGRYFNVMTDYSTTNSTAEKSILVKDGFTSFIAASFSTTLFWFYQQVYTDGLNLKSYEIDNFPLPDFDRFDKSVLSKVENAYRLYIQDIERNAEIQNVSGKSSYNISQLKVYKIRKSKKFVDELDDLICPLYGLTPQETEYIKNYEIEFRLSGDE